MVNIRLLLTLIMLISVTQVVNAQDSDDLGLPQIEISPKKCVLEHEGETCLVTLRFTTRTLKKGRHCVYKYGEYRPLYCFKRIVHQEENELEITKAQTFVLVDEAQGTKVSTAEFSVLTFSPAKLRKRRKRSWGIM